MEQNIQVSNKGMHAEVENEAKAMHANGLEMRSRRGPKPKANERDAAEPDPPVWTSHSNRPF